MGVGSDLSPLRIRVSWDHLTATVGVGGELDANTAPGLIEALLEVAITARPERFVLNVADLVVLDMAGAKVIDQARRTLGTRCPVTVCNLRPSAREMFRLAGIQGWEPGAAA